MAEFSYRNALVRKMSDFLELYKMARDIAEADLTWEEKHQLIFSSDIAAPAQRLYSIEYPRSATGFEPMVRDFIKAFAAQAMVIQKAYYALVPGAELDAQT